jgi:hypothetical protein
MELEEYLNAIQKANDEKVANLTAIADKKAAAILAAAITAQEETLAAVKAAFDIVESVNSKRIAFEQEKQDAYDKELRASQKEVVEEIAEFAVVKKSK